MPITSIRIVIENPTHPDPDNLVRELVRDPITKKWTGNLGGLYASEVKLINEIQRVLAKYGPVKE